VGRPTKWGNHFVVNTHGTASQCAELYYNWLRFDEEGIKVANLARQELVNKDLICWCIDGVGIHGDLQCHAQALMLIANAPHKVPADIADFWINVATNYTKYPQQRYGQILFNVLSDMRPDLSKQVIDQDFDPYYTNSVDDKRVQDFTSFLTRNW
jgi:hypothetical protein